MSGALTNDFDAVVQISLRSVYPLPATTHQNNDANTALMSFCVTPACAGAAAPFADCCALVRANRRVGLSRSP